MKINNKKLHQTGQRNLNFNHSQVTMSGTFENNFERYELNQMEIRILREHIGFLEKQVKFYQSRSERINQEHLV